jgi:hypothetical protein
MIYGEWLSTHVTYAQADSARVNVQHNDSTRLNVCILVLGQT